MKSVTFSVNTLIEGSCSKNPELKVVLELKKRDPKVWLDLIESLPEDIRPQVARVIWWDFFAGRMAVERWPHLDKYLRPRSRKEQRLSASGDLTPEQIADIEFGRNISQDEMANALVKCGYPEEYAFRRAYSKDAERNQK